jgi:hypothetical protein
METNLIKREYNTWKFYAVDTITEQFDRPINIVYSITNGEESIELYKGENYIYPTQGGKVGKSWSRQYKDLTKVPQKYKNIVNELKKIHKLINWNLIENN